MQLQLHVDSENVLRNYRFGDLAPQDPADVCPVCRADPGMHACGRPILAEMAHGVNAGLLGLYVLPSYVSCPNLASCKPASRNWLSWRSLTVERWQGFALQTPLKMTFGCRNAEFMELKCELTPDQGALYDAAVSVWQVKTLPCLPKNIMVNGEHP